MNLIASEILQNTIRDYNLWASKKGKGYDIIKAYADLRGIFFNKLTSLIQNSPYKRQSKHHLLRCISPEDLECKFKEGAILTDLQLKRPTGYVDPMRFEMLCDFQACTPHLIYEVMCEDACYLITTSISNIENFNVQL